jgi:excisionase family DNA binding protein
MYIMTSTPATSQRFFSPDLVAEKLSLSTKTIRRWIDRGELHVHRFGRQIRISEDDLAAFLARHRR